MSEAVWLVLAARGFGGLTLRAVAAQMGVSTGLLTHYFPDKRSLIRHAVDVAERRAQQRTRHSSEQEGLPALRSALLDVLPLTPESGAMSRVWVGYWDGALADEDLGMNQQRRYARWRAALREHIAAARRDGEVGDTDPDDLAAISAAFAHGLVVQALFDPGRFPPVRQTELLDQFLHGLAASGARPFRSTPT
ncbi:TetR/AcrR family transcriptional regulator [Micromonospora purpureochromogenes]|uniref:AcrR family transcriptional regulator n=1 Tax=Micromonospora purpureochromogenes TaxID=47872 RepID=A0ABX2RIC5_9ACTN|nr:TetR/AcrR family transcriptional regulator [Micromonospora purpureochromogenes]NYF56091.1 AcrR family transcriptional regulator [Micromonospora purpureochromogenes]